MSDAVRSILVVTPVPADLREALSRDYRLDDFDKAADGSWPKRPGFSVALTTSMAGADVALMDALPDLKLIACQGVGLDKIDLEAAKERGITVANTPDVLTQDTADFAIALIFAVSRNIVRADQFVRAGRWGAERMVPSRRVSGKNCGIVGLGRIGETVAQRAAGLGMSVRYSGPREKPGAPYAYVADVAELARQSDFLVLTCPGGPATNNLVDAAVLDALGPDGILINIARGSVVDEAALIAALRDRRITGAGLDVFAAEPSFDKALLEFETVVLQPHYASITFETRKAIIGLLQAAIAKSFNDNTGRTS
jgi:lactate dehydrogenase-like 2-hydroxyacid dehydrogenase